MIDPSAHIEENLTIERRKHLQRIGVSISPTECAFQIDHTTEVAGVHVGDQDKAGRRGDGGRVALRHDQDSFRRDFNFGQVAERFGHRRS